MVYIRATAPFVYIFELEHDMGIEYFKVFVFNCAFEVADGTIMLCEGCLAVPLVRLIPYQ